MITPDDVTNYLQSLGSTSDAVADSLRKMGITGNTGLCYSCPIAMALASRFPSYLFQIGPCRITVRRSKFDHMLGVVIPRPIGDFIARFDNGHYKDLHR